MNSSQNQFMGIGNKAARVLYGVGIAGLGVQQFIYADFRPVVWPPGWPSWIHSAIWAYIVGAALVVSAAFIILGSRVRLTSLCLGGFLFFVMIVVQCPYVLFIQPNLPRHLALWTDPLKELALAGGAFVAAALSGDADRTGQTVFQVVLEKLVPYGRIFFSITMIAFGIDHFLYTEFVAGLIPSWFPDHRFWTCLAGVCLIGSGVAIILEMRVVRIALLLSVMLFLWVVLLHVPRSIADPFGLQGNEITSLFEALAFSGTALGIGRLYRHRETNTEITFSKPRSLA